MAFSFPIRVYIEDTDAGGIVYHANHLKFCERARTEWLRAAGIDHYLLAGDFSFVVHHIDMHYHKPAQMDDLLHVTVTPMQCKAASFRLRQTIWREHTLIAEATIDLACLDRTLKPRRLPAHIHALIVRDISA